MGLKYPWPDVWSDRYGAVPMLAYHAAAHTIMQLELGRRCNGVAIEKAHEDGRFSVELESDAFTPDTRDWLAALGRDCLYTIAGSVIEEHISGCAWPTRLAEDDETHVLKFLQLRRPEAPSRDSIEYLRRQAWWILGAPHVIYRVIRVADALSSGSRLSERQLISIVRSADERTMTHSELLRLRWRRARRITHPASPVLRPAGGQPDHDECARQPHADSIAIERLAISPLSRATLKKRLRVETVEQLLRWTKTELSGMRTVGATTLADIEEALIEIGLRLRP